MYTAGIYLLKVNNRNTRARYKICSKLTTKTPEQRRLGIKPIESTRHTNKFLFSCAFKK